MTKEQRDAALERLLDVRAGRAMGDSGFELDSEDRAAVDALAQVADLLWEAVQGAPPLDQDPVAAMLGLVPDLGYELDPKMLTRARKAAGLKTSDLANRLTTRGWEVTYRDVYHWETRSTADVSPALIKAIAEETASSADKLVTTDAPGRREDWTTAVVQSLRFTSLVERWSKLQSVSPALAKSELESRTLAIVHRGDRPDPDQLLQSLEALLTARERGGEPRRES